MFVVRHWLNVLEIISPAISLRPNVMNIVPSSIGVPRPIPSFGPLPSAAQGVILSTPVCSRAGRELSSLTVWGARRPARMFVRIPIRLDHPAPVEIANELDDVFP